MHSLLHKIVLCDMKYFYPQKFDVKSERYVITYTNATTTCFNNSTNVVI